MTLGICINHHINEDLKYISDGFRLTSYLLIRLVLFTRMSFRLSLNLTYFERYFHITHL